MESFCGSKYILMEGFWVQNISLLDWILFDNTFVVDIIIIILSLIKYCEKKAKLLFF